MSKQNGKNKKGLLPLQNVTNSPKKARDNVEKSIKLLVSIRSHFNIELYCVTTRGISLPSNASKAAIVIKLSPSSTIFQETITANLTPENEGDNTIFSSEVICLPIPTHGNTDFENLSLDVELFGTRGTITRSSPSLGKGRLPLEGFKIGNPGVAKWITLANRDQPQETNAE